MILVSSIVRLLLLLLVMRLLTVETAAVHYSFVDSNSRIIHCFISIRRSSPIDCIIPYWSREPTLVFSTTLCLMAVLHRLTDNADRGNNNISGARRTCTAVCYGARRTCTAVCYDSWNHKQVMLADDNKTIKNNKGGVPSGGTFG